MGNSSRISGFYKLTPAERRRIIVDWPAVSPEQRAALEAALAESGGLALAQADKMVENVVGTFALPLGIATNFVVNGQDVLIPMVIAERAKWFRIALICTVASVLGAFLGYAIGALFFDLVGRPILELYGKADAFAELTTRYNAWGGWAVLFAAMTPFPYKVLTIFSGVTGLNLVIFTVVSIIGRGVRFFLVAWLLNRYGAPIKGFIENNLGMLFTLFMVLLVGGFVVLRYLM